MTINKSINHNETKLIELSAFSEKEINVFIHGFSAFLNQNEEDNLIGLINSSIPDSTNLLFRWDSGNIKDIIIDALPKSLDANIMYPNIYSMLLSIPYIAVTDIIKTFKAHQSYAKIVSQQLIMLLEKYLERHKLTDVKVNFFAHSLGAVVLTNSLIESNKSLKFTINNIALLGGAVCSLQTDWGAIFKGIKGKLYNFYSSADKILMLKPDLEKNVGSYPILTSTSNKLENIHFINQGHSIYWSYIDEIYKHFTNQSTLVYQLDNGERVMRVNDFTADFDNEFNEIRKNIKKPNIFVLGGTGVGKSSLINNIFGENIADVGSGAPVTEGIHQYSHELYNIYDSEGYETGEEQQKHFEKLIISFIKNRDVSLQDKIHIAWYCISLANHRLFDIDIQIINAIRDEKVPVAIVLTQADQCTLEESELLKNEIANHLPSVTIFESSIDTSMNLSNDELIEWSINSLDESLKMAFASAISSKKIKRDKSSEIIIKYSTMAATAAAIPIPFADAPIIVGLQMKMIASLASLWNIPNIYSLVGSGAFGMLVSQVGKSIAGNLVKLIPGVGAVGGGVVNATVASTLTAAMGYAFIEIFERFMNDSAQGIQKNIDEYFDKNLIVEFIQNFMQKNN